MESMKIYLAKSCIWYSFRNGKYPLLCRINTISVNTDTPCKKAATKFFNAKIVLYQCGSTDIIQSKAAREKVIARMKINIFE
jgi:hypothetical protein